MTRWHGWRYKFLCITKPIGQFIDAEGAYIATLQRMSRSGLAWLGLVLVIAPLYFVSPAVLKYGFEVGALFDPLAALFADPGRLRFLNLVVTPVVFFGGCLLALALNLFALLGIRVEDGRRFRSANFVIVLVSSLLLLVMATYGYLENFTHR